MNGGSTVGGRPLGATGLIVSPVCIGTSPLANMPGLYGYEVDAATAIATIRAAFDSPFTFMDTSNGYGADGLSERRIGEAIRDAGGLPDGFVLATKVDPDPATGDFSGARVRASVDESLGRLGMSHLPLLYLHDPERISFAEGMARGGAVEALIALKEEGVVANIGVAGGEIGVLLDYVGTGVFDVVLNHNRFTLVDRSAEPLIDETGRRGMGFVNAAPYGGGMLVKGPDAQPKYAYGNRDAGIRDSVLAMMAACAEFDVPLAAAALQFSVRDPRIDSTVVGVSSPERIRQTLDLLEAEIPEVLWERLFDLTPGAEHWLD
jgi:D-threo-aldose 1-dehydrogenase